MAAMDSSTSPERRHPADGADSIDDRPEVGPARAHNPGLGATEVQAPSSRAHGDAPPMLLGAKPVPLKLGKELWTSSGDCGSLGPAKDVVEIDDPSHAQRKEEGDVAKARLVSFVSLAASLIAACLGIGIGVSEETLSLVGFGMEALLDGISSALVLWRFKKAKSQQHEDEEAAAQFNADRDARRERNGGIGIGATFVGSAALLFSSAAYKLLVWNPDTPEHLHEEIDGANYGILLSFPSAIIFGGLAYWKWKLGNALGSQVLRKDALCSVLGAVLAGICAVAGLLEESSDNPESMAAVDAVASACIAFILLAEGSRTLWHNLGSSWEEEHRQMA